MMILSKEVIRNIEAIIDSYGENYEGTKQIFDIQELSSVENMTPKILKFILHKSWDFPNKFFKHDRGQVYTYDLNVLRYQLSGRQLRRVVKYIGLGRDIRKILDLLLTHPIDNRIRITIIENYQLFAKLLCLPDYLKRVFPKDDLIIKKIMLKELWRPDYLVKFLQHNKLTDRELLMIINDSKLMEKNPYEIKYSLMKYQDLMYDHIIKLGYTSAIAWCFCRKEKNGDKIRSLAPEWTHKDDIRMVGPFMSVENAVKCAESTNEDVLWWLALVGPKEVLPLLVGANNNDGFIGEVLEARFRGETKAEEKLRVKAKEVNNLVLVAMGTAECS
jgi:hypothetical protein